MIDTSHLSQVVVPVELPHIDDSTVQYAIDSTGKTVRDANNRSVAIARDLISGKWYAKVSDHWPESEQRSSMTKAGAVHLHSQKAEMRGVWMPLAASKPSSEASGKKAA